MALANQRPSGQQARAGTELADQPAPASPPNGKGLRQVLPGRKQETRQRRERHCLLPLRQDDGPGRSATSTRRPARSARARARNTSKARKAPPFSRCVKVDRPAATRRTRGRAGRTGAGLGGSSRDRAVADDRLAGQQHRRLARRGAGELLAQLDLELWRAGPSPSPTTAAGTGLAVVAQAHRVDLGRRRGAGPRRGPAPLAPSAPRGCRP